MENKEETQLIDLVENKFSKHRSLPRGTKLGTSNLTEEEKNIIEESNKRFEEKINESKKIEQKRLNSSLAFELCMLHALMNYSSEDYPLSYEELANYMEDPFSEYSLHLSSKYSKETLQKKFKRTIEKFKIAGIAVRQLNNGHCYISNNIGGKIRDRRIFMCKMLDLINRSQLFIDETDRLWTFRQALTFFQTESLSEFRAPVLYSQHYQHFKVDQKILPTIKSAIEKKKNISIEIYNSQFNQQKEKSITVSPYYLGISDGYYYLVASERKKLKIYRLDMVGNVSISRSYYTAFSEIKNLDKLSNYLLIDVKNENFDSICKEFLIKKTVGKYIDVKFKFDIEHFTVHDIIRKFGANVMFEGNLISLKSVPEQIFIDWAALNNNYISIEGNIILENKINKKISTLTEAPANIDKEEIELYIKIHNESCLKEIKKYGSVDVGLENKTIIKCNSSNADKLINYLSMNSRYVSLDQYNKIKGSKEAQKIYMEFIENISWLAKRHENLLIPKHKLVEK